MGLTDQQTKYLVIGLIFLIGIVAIFGYIYLTGDRIKEEDFE